MRKFVAEKAEMTHLPKRGQEARSAKTHLQNNGQAQIEGRRSLPKRGQAPQRRKDPIAEHCASTAEQK